MEREREHYPPPTPQPCNDCPWRRNATPGWLGPYDAFRWLAVIHGESVIACHKTIRDADDEGVGDWDDPAMRQCRGAAIFRSHVCKQPKHPDVETGPDDPDHVFTNGTEFVEHHERREVTDEEVVRRMWEGNVN